MCLGALQLQDRWDGLHDTSINHLLRQVRRPEKEGVIATKEPNELFKKMTFYLFIYLFLFFFLDQQFRSKEADPQFSQRILSIISGVTKPRLIVTDERTNEHLFFFAYPREKKISKKSQKYRVGSFVAIS